MDTQTRQILHASARHFKADAAQFRDGKLWLLNGYCGNGTGEKTPGWSATMHSEADARKNVIGANRAVTFADELAAVAARRAVLGTLASKDLGNYLLGVVLGTIEFHWTETHEQRVAFDLLDLALRCAEQEEAARAKQAQRDAIAAASRGSD